MKRFFYAALVCLCIPLSLFVGSSCGGGDDDGGEPEPATLTVQFSGAATNCLNEGGNEWEMDVFVDNLSGPYSDINTTFRVSDENSTKFNIDVPSSGMYTIMVEIFPTNGTSCMECCSNICAPDDTGEPEFAGTQTFTAGPLSHVVPVNLIDCDCC